MYNTSYFTDEAEIFREVITWQKSQYESTWNKALGYLKNKKNIETQAMENVLWKYYQFTTSEFTDIRQGDVLLIDGHNYNVKDTWLKLGIIVRYLFCILDKKD